MNFKKYAFVISAPNRQKIVMALSTEKTPTQLVKELNKKEGEVCHKSLIWAG